MDVLVKSSGINEAIVPLDKLCRICGAENSHLMAIYGAEGVDHDIAFKMNQHFPTIMVSKNDQLPLQICYQCASTLLVFHTLYELCVQTDKHLRQLLHGSVEGDNVQCQDVDDEASEPDRNVTGESNTRPKRSVGKQLQRSFDLTTDGFSMSDDEGEMIETTADLNASLDDEIDVDQALQENSRDNASSSTQTYASSHTNEDFILSHDILSSLSSCDISCAENKTILNMDSDLKAINANDIIFQNLNGLVNEIASEASETNYIRDSIPNYNETATRVLRDRKAIKNYNDLIIIKKNNNVDPTLTTRSPTNLDDIKSIVESSRKKVNKSELAGTTAKNEVEIVNNDGEKTRENKFKEKMFSENCISSEKLSEVCDNSSISENTLLYVSVNGVQTATILVPANDDDNYEKLAPRWGPRRGPCRTGATTKKKKKCANSVSSKNLKGSNLKESNMKRAAAPKRVYLMRKNLVLFCAYCENQFSNKSVLRAHIKSTHLIIADEVFKNEDVTPTKSCWPILTRYSCYACGTSFAKKEECARHAQETHGEGETHVCLVCNFAYTRADELQTHLFRAHVPRVMQKSYKKLKPQIRYTCEMCGDVLSCRTTYQKHLVNKHSNERKYKCPHCEQSFKVLYNVMQHVRIVHKGVERGTKHAPTQRPYKSLRCAFCANKFKSSDELSQHMNEKHYGELPCWCKFCELRFPTTSSAKYHEKRAHKEDTREMRKTNFPVRSSENDAKAHKTGVRSTTCEYCKARFNYYEEYLHHATAVHPEKLPYACSHCPLLFDNKQRRHYHSKLRHGGARTVEFKQNCQICGMEFKMQYFYKKHVAAHYGRFECDHCSMACLSKEDLERHTNEAHAEIFHRVCDQCGKRFKTQECLSSHLRSVHGPRERCAECGIAVVLHKMKAHMMTHTDEKPHVCDVCGHRFRQRGDYVRHRIKHSNNQVADDASNNIDSVNILFAEHYTTL